MPLLLASCGGSSAARDVTLPAPADAVAARDAGPGSRSRFGFPDTPATPLFEQAAAISLALLRGEDVAAQTGPMTIDATPATRIPPELRGVEASAIEVGVADWRAEMRADRQAGPSADPVNPRPALVGLRGWAFLTRRALLVEAQGGRPTDLGAISAVPPSLLGLSREVSQRLERNAPGTLAVPADALPLLGDYAARVEAERERNGLEAHTSADDEDGFRSTADLLRAYPVPAAMKLESIGVTVRGSDGALHSVQIGVDQHADRLVVGTRWNELAIIERVTTGDAE